ncbi:hypothetical protein FHR32_003984 [Streptosporangium album]|uniref:Uncharacterized protein n=1 Tax=Streptosporangium album TaxID=47479 RepID=A0A7W7RWT8_9ACTN|nr:hypothetical protein [Streptosporangium album]MBB4939679.1 hypothetical protein [Streptosporangium album]
MSNSSDRLHRRAARLQADAEKARAAELAEKARVAEQARVAQLAEQARAAEQARVVQARWSMMGREREWNTAGQVKADQAKVDAKFFDRLWKELTPAHRKVLKGLTYAGLVVGIPMVGYAVWHVGDPINYFDGRNTWNEMLSDLKDSAWDVWITYFSEVSPYWMGHASETVQRYLRFELIGMFDELGRIAVEISTTMSSLAWDITDYNISLVDLMTVFGPTLMIIMPFAGTLPGRAVLVAACFAFLKFLWGLIKELISKMKALDGKLQALNHKMNELQGLFNVGDNKLHLKPVGSDVNFWVPLSKETQ